MPKAKRAAVSSEDRTLVSVDTDQSDTSKAVQRVNGDDADDRKMPDREDSDVSESERRNSVWLDRSRAMNKRVGRMTRNFEQRSAEQEARHQREMRSLRDEVDTLRTTRGKSDSQTDADHEAAMQVLAEKLEAALEAGKSADAAKLQREISRKEAAFWAGKQAAAMGGDDSRSKARERKEEKDDPAVTQVRKPSKAGIAFTEANDWWDDPDFAIERGAANTIFAQLVTDEGADPDDPDTYARVAKRLKRKFSDLDVEVPGKRRRAADDDDDEEEEEEEDEDTGTRRGAKRRAEEAPIQQSRGRDPNYRGASRKRSGEQHLSEKDLKNMRMVGMNPDNEDHLLDYARGKREAEEAERARR